MDTTFADYTIKEYISEKEERGEIIAYILSKASTITNGSGLVSAPSLKFLEEIVDLLYKSLILNPRLISLARWDKRPYHRMIFNNGFKIYFRPSCHNGEAYRGIHVKTFAIKSEAAKDKNEKQWVEFWRIADPGCDVKIYSMLDGDHSCEFYKRLRWAQRTQRKG